MNTTWKLFLDDQWNDSSCVERVAMPSDFVPAASVDQAKILVEIYGSPDEMMLDCDLVEGGESKDFIAWLMERHYREDNSLRAPPKFSVHSKNIIAAQNLRSILENWSKMSS